MAAFVVRATDSLSDEDFSNESFSKMIDLCDYARVHAEAVGGKAPPASWSNQVAVNYINIRGIKLMYMGYSGFKTDKVEVQIPLQSFVEWFNTTRGDAAMTASTFLMLMAFNDTDASLYPGSPDKGDNLWASFSIGTDFSEFFPQGKVSKIQTSVEIIPLKSSSDKNDWTWV